MIVKSKFFSLKYPYIYFFLFIVCISLPILLQRENVFNSSKIKSEREAFENVYDKKLWGEGSGIGSNPDNATPYLQMLQFYFNDPDLNTYIDLGCGDWKLMELINIPSNKQYIGYDLVERIIEENQKKHASNNIHFVRINRLSDFKNVQGDILIVKDVLHHWPIQQINFFLTDILPNFKYALITNDFNLYATNHDIAFADYRPINLEKDPFIPVSQLRILFDYPSHGIIKRVYLYTRD
jgi:hypothetical protein